MGRRSEKACRRLLMAGGLFAALKWQATHWYARGVVELVLWQMAR